MNNVIISPLENLSNALVEVQTLNSLQVTEQRFILATEPKKLASLEAVSEYKGSKLFNAGMDFLKSIHEEIRSKNPAFGTVDELEASVVCQ